MQKQILIYFPKLHVVGALEAYKSNRSWAVFIRISQFSFSTFINLFFYFELRGTSGLVFINLKNGVYVILQMNSSFRTDGSCANLAIDLKEKLSSTDRCL